MRILDATADADAVAKLLAPDVLTESAAHAAAAAEVIAAVRERGDAAVLEQTRRFHAPEMTLEGMVVTTNQLTGARTAVGREFIAAAEVAIANLRDFHQRQLRQDWLAPRPGGGFVGQRFVPIERVGVWIPGGAAVLFSTLLHVVVPAQVAGVRELLVCTPPRPDGSAEPHLLACAALLGMDQIRLTAGTAAIAAMAFGTPSIPKVDFIAGPGNQYVNQAKRLVFGVVGIDSLAGPSEILVIADDSADAEHVAADLLSQAEHTDGRAVLLTPERSLAVAVAAAVERRLGDLPTAPEVRANLARRGGIVVTTDLDQAIALANGMAPEHLELLVREPLRRLGAVRHAGAVFLGPHSPEPLGDYVAGPSHVLPTGGSARFASPIGVDTFQRRASLIAYGPDALATEAEAIVALARAEGLEAHARSIEARKGA